MNGAVEGFQSLEMRFQGWCLLLGVSIGRQAEAILQPELHEGGRLGLAGAPGETQLREHQRDDSDLHLSWSSRETESSQHVHECVQGLQ